MAQNLNRQMKRQTARLILRIPEMADFDAYADMWADEGVNRFISGKTWPRNESWKKFVSNVGHWKLMGYGQWSVLRKDTGEYVGQVGFFDANRDLGDDFDNDREAGWVLAPGADGRGYATEAMLSAHEWMDQQAFGGRTVCMMDAGYPASRRVAEKCGYTEMRRTDDQYGAVVLFERVASDSG